MFFKIAQRINQKYTAKVASIRIFSPVFLNVSKRYFRTQSQFSGLRTIESTNIDESQRRISVKFEDGSREEYPWHFLQDNCTCSQCFHQASKSRLMRMTNFSLQKKVSEVTVSESKEEVLVKWSDGHDSCFRENWLKARSFKPSNLKRRTTGMRDEPRLVYGDHKIMKCDFEKVLQKPESLKSVLNELCSTGVVLMQGAPKCVGQLRRLAEVVGFIRTTHYGNEFTVKSIPNAVNLAYTSATLTVHTDLPYYAYPPGTQALHCIKQFQGSGGDSQLVDGFAVADHMRSHQDSRVRNMYATLCDLPVEFYDVGKDHTEFHKVHHSPTFVKNPRTGFLERIVYSNQQLSSYQPVGVDRVNDFYEAIKTFTDLCYDQRFLMTFKLSEGDVLLFDNWRHLHGRSYFDPALGERHLEGCYIDWDEIFSRINVLNSRTEH